MKSLHIRDISDVTLTKLKMRAQLHHRSLQGEVLSLLEEAAKQMLPMNGNEFSLHVVKVNRKSAKSWSRKDAYED